MDYVSLYGCNIFPFYDDDGNPLGFYLLDYDTHWADDTRGIAYYYVRNVQGDIVQIRNSEQSVVANYHYDAWGKLLSVTDANGNVLTEPTDYSEPIGANIAFLNPIRYRGYVYDNETGFYYLNSRYYDPKVGRFINEDGYVSTGQGLAGYNMFAYCNNNPVMCCDCLGLCPHDLLRYESGPFKGQFRYDPNCKQCRAHGEYCLIYPDGTQVNMYHLPEIEIYENKSMDEKREFMQAVYARGIADEANTGIPAALMAAQAGWESQYGSKGVVLTKNNMFGYNLSKSYATIEENILEYENGLSTLSRYSHLHGQDLAGWVNGIGPAGYNTENPNYNQDLWSVIIMWDLD